jgi:GxxExxY protein
MKHEEITERIIACVAEVHQTLGPGFLESVYRNALVLELGKAALHVETEKEVVVRYLGEEVGRHRLDLVVEAAIVVELKAVADLVAVHYEQLRSYLRATGMEVGLLVNFGRERWDVRRVELASRPR